MEVTYFLNRGRMWLSRWNTRRKSSSAVLTMPGVAVKICHSWTSCLTYSAIPRDVAACTACVSSGPQWKLKLPWAEVLTSSQAVECQVGLLHKLSDLFWSLSMLSAARRTSHAIMHSVTTILPGNSGKAAVGNRMQLSKPNHQRTLVTWKLLVVLLFCPCICITNL